MSADFREQPHARARGRVGEDDAVAWLTVHGYEILQRNLVNHGGEIDVVARDGATLCFLEIKARDGDRFGPAIAAVNFTRRLALHADQERLPLQPWTRPAAPVGAKRAGMGRPRGLPRRATGVDGPLDRTLDRRTLGAGGAVGHPALRRFSFQRACASPRPARPPRRQGAESYTHGDQRRQAPRSPNR
jgi:hypothetical protein